MDKESKIIFAVVFLIVALILGGVSCYQYYEIDEPKYKTLDDAQKETVKERVMADFESYYDINGIESTGTYIAAFINKSRKRAVSNLNIEKLPETDPNNDWVPWACGAETFLILSLIFFASGSRLYDSILKLNEKKARRYEAEALQKEKEFKEFQTYVKKLAQYVEKV